MFGTYVVVVLYPERCRGYIDSCRADYAGSGERGVPDNGKGDRQEKGGVAGGNGLNQGNENRDSDGCERKIFHGCPEDG